MLKITKTLLLPLLSLALLLQTTLAEEARTLQVTATTSIIADWVKEVSGNHLTVKTLAGPDTDIHNFEPTPQDAKNLVYSDVIFENGLDLEYWLERLYRSSASKAKRVKLSQSVPHIISGVSCCEHHDHRNEDPHIWLDAQNALAMVSKIADTLSNLDPSHASDYQKNAAEYSAKLKELDAWIFKKVSELPKEKRQLITNHNTFGYFAKRYDFTILGDMLGSTSTEYADPSANQFTQLVKLINKYHVKAIFAENIQSRNLINQLAKEAKLPKPSVLYTGALGTSNSPASNYESLMRYNVETIVDHLK